MPKSAIPANAEGLSKFSRRSFLVGTAVACSTASIAGEAGKPQMTAMERVDYLLDELKIAVRQANTNVRVYLSGNYIDNPNSPVPLVFMTSWVSGSYDGDGLYYCGEHKSFCEVKLLDELIDSERVFSVIVLSEPEKPMKLTESRLETFICEKVSPAN